MSDRPLSIEKHLDLCVKCGKSIDMTPRPVWGLPFPVQILETPPNLCERCLNLLYFSGRHLVRRPYKVPGFRPRPEEAIPSRYREEETHGPQVHGV